MLVICEFFYHLSMVCHCMFLKYILGVCPNKFLKKWGLSSVLEKCMFVIEITSVYISGEDRRRGNCDWLLPTSTYQE